MRRVLALAALAVLVALLIGVVVVLPDMVAERGGPVGLAPETPPAGVPGAGSNARASPEATARARAKREAERLLGELLRRQSALEADGITVWGRADYDTVLSKLAEGDALFAAGEFVAAARDYTEALRLLELMEASKPERLRAALEAGAAALEAIQGEAAQAAFTIALALDPGNATAAAGLERAKTIEEVAALVETATSRQAEGELDQAREDLQRAIALDREYTPAQTALESVEASIAERDFQKAMSDALAALSRKKFDAARAALNAASAIRPDARVLKDARAQWSAAHQRHRLETYRARGQRLEREERWSEAAKVYDAALGIDAAAGFAKDGLTRSRQRAELDKRIDEYLKRPERLQSREPLTGAANVLAAAASLPDQGPKLRKKLETLKSAVEQASQPVPVLFRSDNRTEVVLQRVGRIGRFTERTLMLRPGTYTAVGMCPGYRDVRREVVIAATKETPAVDIRCEEPI